MRCLNEEANRRKMTKNVIYSRLIIYHERHHEFGCAHWRLQYRISTQWVPTWSTNITNTDPQT